MTYNSGVIRSGLFFSGLWKIGFALFDLNSNTFYVTSQEFTQFTGITEAMNMEKEAHPLQKFLLPQDFEITEGIFHFIRAEIASTKQNHLYQLSFYINVRFFLPSGQFTHLTFNLRVEPDNDCLRSNTVSFICIPEQLFGYERFTLHNLSNKKTLYYSEATGKFVKKQQIELNETEKSILRYINNGLVETKIANQLNININLVKYYKKSIFRKLHVGTTAEAIYIGAYYGII